MTIKYEVHKCMDDIESAVKDMADEVCKTEREECWDWADTMFAETKIKFDARTDGALIFSLCNDEMSEKYVTIPWSQMSCLLLSQFDPDRMSAKDEALFRQAIKRRGELLIREGEKYLAVARDTQNRTKTKRDS